MAPNDSAADASDDEDDYMNMVVPELSSTHHESSIQRRKRKEREGEVRASVKSQKTRDADAAAARESALGTSIEPSSKGFQLLAKLGYKPGERLGAAANRHGLAEPVGLEVKEDRGGIGMDSERKARVREAAAHGERRERETEGGYRERVAQEREDRRREAQVRAAMKVAEEFDEGDEGGADDGAGAPTRTEAERKAKPQEAARPNVLWRGLVRERAERERDRRMRYDLQQSLTRNQNYDDPELDAQDRLALGAEEQELELDDPELDAFNELPVADRLDRLVGYLRDGYCYCFWCKFTYPDKEMEGCPGLTEEDHD